ncbi:hypothetical protein M3Y95_00523500 [Aphelenchoides besseyi]|nr:hypothetical protein M3Y95_00523500 [Aphelenchoides besseyi]
MLNRIDETVEPPLFSRYVSSFKLKLMFPWTVFIRSKPHPRPTSQSSWIKRQHTILLLLIVILCCVHGVQTNLVEDLHRSRVARGLVFKRENKTDEQHNTTSLRPDTICNPSGEHECVCNRSMGDLDGRVSSCDNFLEKRHLTVVSIIMRNVKLNVQLHTNESYQQYFRRRIANIVSQYCEQQVNECPGTMLKMSKEHVVILRVNYLPRRRTEVQFVVTKQPKTTRFHDETLIETSKVKKILATQLAPLARVLGGIQIERLQLVDIDRRQVGSQNYGLMITLSVVASGLIFCYTIACIKVYRDRVQKRRARENPTMLGDKNKRNYGTCADKLLATCEAPNGKVKSKNILSRASITSGILSNNKDRRISATSGANGRRSTQQSHSSARNQHGDENETSIALDVVSSKNTAKRSGTVGSSPSDGTSPLPPSSAGFDTRSFQRMFACDLSQLPAENSELIEERAEDELDEDGVFLDDVISRTSPAAVNMYNEMAPAEVHQQSPIILEPTSHPSTKDTTSITIEPIERSMPPPPIVIKCGSQFSIDKVDETYVTCAAPKTSTSSGVSVQRPDYQHQDSSDSIVITANSFNPPPAPMKPPLIGLLSVDDETMRGLGIPYQRPLSRRGSRDSTPEQGNEEFDEDSSEEEDEAPIGDTVLASVPEDSTISVVNSNGRKPKETTWSSDSEEEETNEAYHALKEEDEDVVLKETPKQTRNADNRWNPREPTGLSSADSADEEEQCMFDRHAYERLEESPLPSPSAVYTEARQIVSTTQHTNRRNENNNTSFNAQSKLNVQHSLDDPIELTEQLPSDYEDLR